jgi:hypothetical protein
MSKFKEIRTTFCVHPFIENFQSKLNNKKNPEFPAEIFCIQKSEQQKFQPFQPQKKTFLNYLTFL